MEISILDWIQSMRTPIGDMVIPLITKLGDAGMIWILLSVVLLLIPRPDDFSFLSGHTEASFAAVSALSFAGERKLWILALVLAVFIAFSRLYLYVHYPTDILGGMIAGVFAGYIGNRSINQFINQLEKRR